MNPPPFDPSLPLLAGAVPADDEPTDPGTGHAQVCQIGTVYAAEWEALSLNSFGGQGEVYNVRKVGTDRVCAMKVLRPASRQDPVCRERFKKEGEVLQSFANLDRGIVQVYQVGTDSEIGPYIVMELLNGNTLEHVAKNMLPPLQVLGAIVELALLIQLVHEQGIIHRDIKPSNIFVHQPEAGPHILKLIDFGAMKGGGQFYIPTTKEGRFIGTPNFMSPEQMRGDRPTPAMDVYGLGVTAYVMLCGRMPFGDGGHGTVDELMVWAIGGMRIPLTERLPTIPKELSDFIDKMIRSRPAERFATMAEVAAAGQTLLDDLRARDADRERHEREEDRVLRERIREEIARAAEPAGNAQGGMATGYNLHLAPAADPDDEWAVMSAQRAHLLAQVAAHQKAVAEGRAVLGNLDLSAVEHHVRQLEERLLSLPAPTGPSAAAVGGPNRARVFAEAQAAHRRELLVQEIAKRPPIAQQVTPPPFRPNVVTQKIVYDGPRPNLGPGPALAAPAPAAEPIAEQRFASLVGLEGAYQHRAWEIALDVVRIGRDPGSHIVLVDASVSALHATLKPARQTGEEVGLELVDAGSANGTKVNGERIERARLRDRDRITIGRVKLEYRLLGGEPAAKVLRAGTPRTEKISEELPQNWHEMTAAYRQAMDRPPPQRQRRAADAMGTAPGRHSRWAIAFVFVLLISALVIAYLVWSRR